jgi:hypothetical protein
MPPSHSLCALTARCSPSAGSTAQSHPRTVATQPRGGCSAAAIAFFPTFPSRRSVGLRWAWRVALPCHRPPGSLGFPRRVACVWCAVVFVRVFSRVPACVPFLLPRRPQFRTRARASADDPSSCVGFSRSRTNTFMSMRESVQVRGRTQWCVLARVRCSGRREHPPCCGRQRRRACALSRQRRGRAANRAAVEVAAAVADHAAVEAAAAAAAVCAKRGCVLRKRRHRGGSLRRTASAPWCTC